jgi:beta-lactamase regulating signal transducer with metallopeptidase domain
MSKVMMNNSLVLRIRAGFIFLGTVAATHVSAATQNSTHSLLPTAGTIGFAREAVNTTGSTLLLAVAGGLIVLGSVLRRNLTSKSAQEQAPTPTADAKRDFACKPLEKATPLSVVTPKANAVAASEASTPMPKDTGVRDEQNLRLA